MEAAENFTNQFASGFTTGVTDGLIKGIQLIGPYIGIILAFYLIRGAYKLWKKKRK